MWLAEYFSNGGRKKAACATLGIPYNTLKDWLKRPDFQARMKELEDEWADTLRAVAIKRALQKSDTLLIFMLKSLEREKYDDAVAKAKYEQDHGIERESAPIRAVLVFDEPPERIKQQEQAPVEH